MQVCWRCERKRGGRAVTLGGRGGGGGRTPPPPPPNETLIGPTAHFVILSDQNPESVGYFGPSSVHLEF